MRFDLECNSNDNDSSSNFCTYFLRTAKKTYLKMSGSARGVMVIVIGNGHGYMSSNPGQGLIAFHIALIPLGRYESNYSPSRYWVNSRAD